MASFVGWALGHFWNFQSLCQEPVALQLLYSVCETFLSIIYGLVYELIQGVFFIAALLTAEQTSLLLRTDH